MSEFLLLGAYSRSPYADPEQSDALFLIKLDLATGQLHVVARYNDVENASFLVQRREHVFVVSEATRTALARFRVRWFEARSTDTGRIESTPLLELQGRAEWSDAGGCFVCLTDDDSSALVSCYDAGTLQVIENCTDSLRAVERGRLQLPDRRGPFVERQEGPHAHCVVPWPDKTDRFAVVDLGADMIYQVMLADNRLTLMEGESWQLPPGTGPRHLLFHPTRPLAFLVAELTNELWLVHRDSVSGRLSEVQRLPLVGLPDTHVNDPTYAGQWAAHVALSADGHFVLVSNRGRANDILVFRLDETEARLELTDTVPASGSFPRFFQLVQDRFLLVANQRSANVVVFSFCKGRVSKTPLSQLSIANPVALLPLTHASN